MNCKHLKQKLNRTIYCKAKSKEIRLSECNSCICKEYKTQQYISNKAKTQNNNKISLKSKSSKLAKLERNRFSLFTDDLEHCIICGEKKDNLHEVFFGRNRQNSMKYKLVLPLCFKHHREMHDNIILQNEYKKRGQALFEETYPDLDFVEIFGKNYL